ncbi:MAG: hypothetical protein R3228_16595, partial [Halioglobus sp.]|nr:hypothetical protein [Halioglobus sp.]
MNLRRQLLLVSLLLLSLPWAGCQFIREMEGALRQGQVQSLQASANAVAAVVAQDETLLYPNPQRRSATLDEAAPLYAFAAAGPVLVDGYGDGWQDVPARRFRNETGDTTIAVSVQAQTRGELLYLLLRVEDKQVVYHNPGVSTQANGDRLVLRLWRDDRRQDY